MTKAVMDIAVISSVAEIHSLEGYPIVNGYFGGGAIPPTVCRIAFVKAGGFAVAMECRERNPLARYKNHDEPVYEDSCMEFFADFCPQGGKGYLNFEANANGAMLSMLGPTRENRAFLRQLGLPRPDLRVTVGEESWAVEWFFPLSFIERIYGNCDFEPGCVIRGNFYKCGDKTAVPHWGTLFPLRADTADFHRPETFGEMVISA